MIIGSIHQEAVTILNTEAPITKILPTAHEAWCAFRLPCQLHPHTTLSHHFAFSSNSSDPHTFLFYPQGLCIPLNLPCLQLLPFTSFPSTFLLQGPSLNITFSRNFPLITSQMRLRCTFCVPSPPALLRTAITDSCLFLLLDYTLWKAGLYIFPWLL